MFDYLQQFNNLPKNLRDQVSSPQAMAVLTELENKYKLDLAMVVMKVMIRNITINGLSSYFTSEDGLTREAAAELTRELKEKIFIGVADYLGITSDIRALDLEKDIKIVIAEAGLTISSSELINRFKSILATYLRGVRAKIDTRAVLGKEVIGGGLNLSPAEIDRVFKVCDTQKFKSLNINISPSLSPSPVNSTPAHRPVIVPSNQLNKIINNSDGKLAAAGKIADYNLKDMIARGQVKKPQLDLPLQEKQLDLPYGEVALKLEKDLKINEPVNIAQSVKTIEPIKTVSPVSLVSPLSPIKAVGQVKQNTPFVSPVKGAPSVQKTVSSIIPPISKVVPIIPLQPSQARQALSPTPNSKRPVMHDIKPMPKVMGPIEELQFLDVVNFRRLGTTPVEAVTKIFNKIKLLEKEGYDKMILGIKAWRQSPVNRLYIKIGQEAISSGVTIKEAALARQKNNPEYLKIEEIEALVNLNSKLVF